MNTTKRQTNIKLSIEPQNLQLKLKYNPKANNLETYQYGS